MVSAKSLLSPRTLAVAALLASFAPMPAFARDVDMGGETFDHSTKLGDAELATMRGGFIDVNGMLIDFSFLSRVSIGLSLQQDVTVNTDNLALAAQTATQIQDLLQPTVIQNMDNDTLISIQQALNVNIVGIDILGQLAQVGELNHLQAGF